MRAWLAGRCAVVILIVLAACSSRDGGVPSPDAGPGVDSGSSTDGGRRIVPETCDPVTGAGCDCPDVGATRACMETGECPGVQECVLAGEFARWTECDEAPSTPETCNGADDDCDGLTDEGFRDETCGVGACETTVQAWWETRSPHRVGTIQDPRR